MRTLSKPREWPITIKVPLLVAVLMLAISFVISNTVLSRLARTQERNLQALSRTYIEGLSTNLLPHMLREDVWEVFDTLDRASKSGSRSFASALVEVFNDDGSTQAMAYPTPTARKGETFMLFAYPTGVQGNVVNAGVNELIIPNYKQTWANIRKISDAPDAVRHLTFKSKEYVS